MLLLISAHNELERLSFFCILSEKSGCFLLGAEQQTERCLLLQGFLQLPFYRLFLRRTDGLPHFIQLHRVKIHGLRFQLGIFSQCLIQSMTNSMWLLFSFKNLLFTSSAG